MYLRKILTKNNTVACFRVDCTNRLVANATSSTSSYVHAGRVICDRKDNFQANKTSVVDMYMKMKIMNGSKNKIRTNYLIVNDAIAQLCSNFWSIYLTKH